MKKPVADKNVDMEV